MDVLDEIDCILSPESDNAKAAISQLEVELCRKGNAQLRAEKIQLAQSMLPNLGFARFNLLALRHQSNFTQKTMDREETGPARWKRLQSESARIRAKLHNAATVAIDNLHTVPMSLAELRSRGVVQLHTI